jgi:hypothetical protein
MFLVLLLLHVSFSACTSVQEGNLLFLLSASYQIGRFSARPQSSRIGIGGHEISTSTNNHGSLLNQPERVLCA